MTASYWNWLLKNASVAMTSLRKHVTENIFLLGPMEWLNDHQRWESELDRIKYKLKMSVLLTHLWEDTTMTDAFQRCQCDWYTIIIIIKIII
jgi:hypothetical protein